jgi:hypothetical protein
MAVPNKKKFVAFSKLVYLILFIRKKFTNLLGVPIWRGVDLISLE